MKLQSIESAVEKFKVVCEQADQYQEDAGYPVEVSSANILMALFTQDRTQTKEALLKMVDRTTKPLYREESKPWSDEDRIVARVAEALERKVKQEIISMFT